MLWMNNQAAMSLVETIALFEGKKKKVKYFKPVTSEPIRPTTPIDCFHCKIRVVSNKISQTGSFISLALKMKLPFKV